MVYKFKKVAEEAPVKTRTARKVTATPKATTDDGELASNILDYASKHEKDFYYQTDMAKELGADYSQVNYTVKKLIKRGLLDKNFNKGKFIVLAKKSEKEPNQTTPPEKKPNESAFADLVFKYIRETRNTDLLGFLTWLESK